MGYSGMEIPDISNRRLGRLARLIQPVISLTTTPIGRWPQEEVRVYYLKRPKDLRLDNFLVGPHLRPVPFRLCAEGRIKTLHVPGMMLGRRVFYPTLDEVFAQIPEQYLFDSGELPANHIVAFETFLEGPFPSFDESGRFHVATTVLLTKGAPDFGTMRTHYP